MFTEPDVVFMFKKSVPTTPRNKPLLPPADKRIPEFWFVLEASVVIYTFEACATLTLNCA